MAAIRAFDLVLTPTGRRAIVRLVDPEGFAEIAYLLSPRPRELGVCHERLLTVLRLARAGRSRRR